MSSSSPLPLFLHNYGSAPRRLCVGSKGAPATLAQYSARRSISRLRLTRLPRAEAPVTTLPPVGDYASPRLLVIEAWARRSVAMLAESGLLCSLAEIAQRARAFSPARLARATETLWALGSFTRPDHLSAYPARKTLAERAQRGERTISRGIADLVTLGILVARRSDRVGQNYCAAYALHPSIHALLWGSVVAREKHRLPAIPRNKQKSQHPATATRAGVSTAKNTRYEATVEALVANGVRRREALRLVARFGIERVEIAIKQFPCQSAVRENAARNPAGLLVMSIVRNYIPPKPKPTSIGERIEREAAQQYAIGLKREREYEQKRDALRKSLQTTQHTRPSREKYAHEQTGNILERYARCVESTPRYQREEIAQLFRAHGFPKEWWPVYFIRASAASAEELTIAKT